MSGRLLIGSEQLHQFGQSIRLHRQARGWTQEQLGAHLGITQSMVSIYENGGSSLRFSTMVTIAKLLGSTVCRMICPGHEP